MVRYSFQEQAEMVFVYGQADGNGREAARLYQNKYPHRHQPHHTTFQAIFGRLCDHGSFQTDGRAGRRRTVRTPDLEEQVLQDIETNPSISSRQVARQHGVSQSTIMCILHDNRYYPYHLQRVQGLSPADFPLREGFRRWFLHQTITIMGFLSSVLFTDEATFTRNGIINLHNRHLWATENPRGMVKASHQHRFSINVWAGILGDHILGPVILPQRLNGGTYLDFLQNILPGLLENVPLAIRQVMWFLHDGAPPHFRITVRRHLNNILPRRWIGRGGPVAWPARSPDLNPLDFYLWGHLKSVVYAEPVPDVQTLQQRVHDACDAIRREAGTCERVRQSMIRRVNACIASHGGHFEHLL